ncbi:hypothetical protein KKG83_07445 [Candidatus Micrarchaeota archaeon]|nr:hypothetical protein [Candidatus Micrarchaeota archaeon]MBU2477274.1 hypothetical protein [Candidatus Micrarchaeota archaeon]
MKKAILIAGLILLITLFLFLIFFNEEETEFADAKKCGSDLDCLKHAAQKGEKAVAFIEETPTPYSQSELRQAEIQGIKLPEKKGTKFSHLVQSCENELCNVKIKIQEFETGTPEFITGIMQNFNEMECKIPIKDLGTFPEDPSNCSGALIEGIKQLDKQMTPK